MDTKLVSDTGSLLRAFASWLESYRDSEQGARALLEAALPGVDDRLLVKLASDGALSGLESSLQKVGFSIHEAGRLSKLLGGVVSLMAMGGGSLAEAAEQSQVPPLSSAAVEKMEAIEVPAGAGLGSLFLSEARILRLAQSKFAEAARKNWAVPEIRAYLQGSRDLHEAEQRLASLTEAGLDRYPDVAQKLVSIVGVRDTTSLKQWLMASVIRPYARANVDKLLSGVSNG